MLARRAGPGASFLVDSFQDDGHHRVAVLGPQLGVRPRQPSGFPGVTIASRSCGQRNSDDRAASPSRSGPVGFEVWG